MIIVGLSNGDVWQADRGSWDGPLKLVKAVPLAGPCLSLRPQLPKGGFNAFYISVDHIVWRLGQEPTG